MTIKWQGLEIVIESPVALRYGYIRGTKGEDGAALDALVGKHLDSPFVFIFDKVHRKSKRFDETKILIGFYSPKGALKGWQRKYDLGQLGEMRQCTVKQFLKKLARKWNRSGTKSVHPGR